MDSSIKLQRCVKTVIFQRLIYINTVQHNDMNYARAVSAFSNLPLFKGTPMELKLHTTSL